MKWTELSIAQDRHGRVHRCIQQPLGTSNGRDNNLSTMDGGGAGPPYQLEGVEGHMAPGSPPGSARTLHQNRVRQHNNNRTHQQVRRDTIANTDEPHLQRLDTLSADEHSIEDDLRSISLQSRGCAIQENDHPTRVANQPYIFQPVERKLGRTQHRPIRLTRKRQSFMVRLLGGHPHPL